MVRSISYPRRQPNSFRIVRPAVLQINLPKLTGHLFAQERNKRKRIAPLYFSDVVNRCLSVSGDHIGLGQKRTMTGALCEAIKFGSENSEQGEDFELGFEQCDSACSNFQIVAPMRFERSGVDEWPATVRIVVTCCSFVAV